MCTPDPAVQGTLSKLAGDKYLISSTSTFVPKSGDCGSEWTWVYMFALIVSYRICILPLFVVSVIGSLLEYIDDQRSIVTWADIVIFREEWTPSSSNVCLPGSMFLCGFVY